MSANVKKPTKQLNPKQEAFVREYLIDFNATEAAKRAGYSAKTAYSTGHELLKKPEIFNRVREEQLKLQERTEVTQDYVVSTIVDTIERCRQAKPVTNRDGSILMSENADGLLAPTYRFDPTNVLKGLEMLGKHLGLFVDRIEMNGKMQVDSLSSLIDELTEGEDD